MNNPPTAVGGIRGFVSELLCRLGMNNPPTAVGGIRGFVSELLFRSGMNHPPTAVGGIDSTLPSSGTNLPYLCVDACSIISAKPRSSRCITSL
jgi:hypothetical protein